jgi:hypothetical protein
MPDQLLGMVQGDFPGYGVLSSMLIKAIENFSVSPSRYRDDQHYKTMFDNYRKAHIIK